MAEVATPTKITPAIQKMMETVLAWPDFSSYGVELLLQAAKDPKTSQPVRFYVLNGGATNPNVLRGVAEAKKSTVDYGGELSLADFELRNVPGVGPMLVAGYKPSVSAVAMQRHLPLTTVRSLNFFQITHGAKAAGEMKLEASRAARAEVEARLQVFKDRKPIGMNADGEPVYEIDGVRTIRLPDSSALPLGPEADPKRFLNFGPDDTLEACKALIHDLVHGIRTNGRDSVAYWKELVFGARAEEVTSLQLGEQFDNALREYLAVADLSPGERFETSIAMLEKKPPTFVTKHVGREAIDYKAPIPIGVLGAVLLGPEANINGKSVFVPAAGSGTLLTGLPKDIRLTATEMNPAALGDLVAIAEAKGFTASETYAADATKAEFPSADVVLAQPPSNTREAATISGITTDRIDYQVMLKSLESRAPDGQAVFILGGDQTKGAIEGQSWDVLAHVYAHYEVDGLAEINGSVFSDRVGTTNQRVLVVGKRREQPVTPNVPERIEPLMTYDEVWAWAQSYYEKQFGVELERTSPAQSTNLNAVSSNPFQKQYRPASAGDVSTLVPRNLEGATVTALERVVRDLGDVDELVKLHLGWTDNELYDRLAAEQIDALAMQIHANRRNRGFMIADETGIGKGRVLAAAAAIEMMAGETVVVVTEGTHHFRDLYNDFKAIGAEGLLRPLIFNHDVDITDSETGEIMIPGTSLSEIEDIIQQGVLPEKYNIVFLTYSQINKSPDLRTKRQISRDAAQGIHYRPGELEPREAEKLGSQKARLFQRVVDGSFLVLDEAHNGAGDSATNRNVDAAAILAKNVIYSSASPSTTIHNVSTYFRLFPEGMDSQQISDVLKRGGEIMMEQYAKALAEDGVYIRREHDMSDVVQNFLIDEVNLQRNEHYADQISSVFQMFVLLSGELDKAINHRLQEFNDQLEALEAPGIRGRYQGMASSNFSSRLHLMNRIMTTAMTADALVAQAVTALDNGQKPFIPLDVTMGSLMKQLQDAYVEQFGLEEVGERAAPDMKDVLRLNLQKMLDIPDIDLGDGEVHAVDVDQPQIRAIYELGLERINELPDLPVSIIDYVKEGIERAGYIVEEISGRTLAYKNGRIEQFKPTDKLEAVDRFNRGAAHALISTSPNGYGVHAGRSFQDQAQRHYIENLLAMDGKKGWQRKGRVKRKDEVVPPVYTTISAGLPAAQRLALIHQVHNSRLAANTMADMRARQADIDGFEIDLLSQAGNAVALRLLEENPDLQAKLGVRDTLQRHLGVPDFRLQPHDRTYIGWFFSKISCIPIEEQKFWIATLHQAYRDHVMDLKARGLSLDTSVLGGTYRIIDQQLFDYGHIDDVDSVFSKPIYLATIEGVEKQDPIRSPQLLSMVDMGDQRLGLNRSAVLDAENYIARNKDRFLEAFWDSKQGSMAEAIANPETKVHARHQNITWLQEVLKNIRPGSEITFSDNYDEETKSAVITGIRVPSYFDDATGKQVINEKQFTSTSAWQITFLVAGEKHERTSTLRVMSTDPAFELRDGLHGKRKDAILKAFDSAPSGERRFTRRVLTGNMFGALKMAIEKKLGSPVYYQDVDGVRNSAVLLNKKSRDLQLKAAVLPHEAIREYAILHPNTDIAPRITSPGGDARNKPVEIFANGDGQIFANLPTGTLRRRMRGTAAFQGLEEQNNWARVRSAIEITHCVPEFTEALKQAGIQLVVPNTDRQWVNEWLSQAREQRFRELSQQRQFGHQTQTAGLEMA